MGASALSHFVKVTFGLDRPYTQTTNNERGALAKYSKHAKVAVEIGVFEGVNTVLIAKSQPRDGTLFGIDPFFKGRIGLCYYEKIARFNLKKNKVESKVRLLPMYSHEALDHVTETIDFIFIDGDHSYDGIKTDWNDWSAKVNPGGYIALHDTSISDDVPGVAHQGSYQFFNDTIIKDNRFSLMETIDSLNILKRKTE